MQSSSSSSKSRSFANAIMIRISSHSWCFRANDDNVVECDLSLFSFNVVECDFSSFLLNVVECDSRLLLSSRNEVAFHSLFTFLSAFVKRSRTRIKWQTKSDCASSLSITWFWKNCTWLKVVRQNDESNESKRKRSNVLRVTTNVMNVTSLTSLTNVTNAVIVFFFLKIKESF